MKVEVIFASVVFFAAAASGSICLGQNAGSNIQVTVDNTAPGIPLSPDFYGLMTEEINHAYDGGLYAELIQNRNFKANSNDPVHWSVVQDGGGVGRIALSTNNPASAALTNSLEINIAQAHKGQRVGAANDGYWGIPVKPATTYQVSFLAEGSNGFSGPVGVSIESADGSKVYASGSVPQITSEWKQYALTLKTRELTASQNDRFVIFGSGPGTIRLSLVSLFPPTYNNRPNGNRIDLMEKLHGLNPAFLRLPGGNYLDPGHFIWQNTVGPLRDRPGSGGAWGYPIDEGLGLLEMCEWCEDLHMLPLLAVSDGRSWLPSDGDITPLVQSALDEIEYVSGASTTKWGAQRAKDGHPAPFTLKYIEVGNEDFFDKRDVYNARFASFYDAIKAKYPKLLIIATRRDVTSRVPDLTDEHYYRSIYDMESHANQYDSYSRTGPKIFVGEWATTVGSPTPVLAAAVSDGAWLTGLERNADIISLESYAPLFVNVNSKARQWGTNLIGYDNLASFGSPSYYVQSMFASDHGDVELPTTVQGQLATAVADTPSGGVGVGTWNTQAEFKDESVTSKGVTLTPKDPNNSFADWKSDLGTWSTNDNVLGQTGNTQLSRTVDIQPNWTDYSFHVSARKTGGSEGFLIMFHVRDSNNFLWWNIGGWGNTKTQIEKSWDGGRAPVGPAASITVDTGRWYDIRIDVDGTDIKCYLDGKLITDAADQPTAVQLPVFASSSRETATGDIILHLVNAGSSALPLNIALHGNTHVSNNAKVDYITGAPDDQNTIDQPEKVVPQSSVLTNASSAFVYNAPANSVSVIHLKAH